MNTMNTTKVTVRHPVLKTHLGEVSINPEKSVLTLTRRAQNDPIKTSTRTFSLEKVHSFILGENGFIRILDTHAQNYMVQQVNPTEHGFSQLTLNDGTQVMVAGWALNVANELTPSVGKLPPDTPKIMPTKQGIPPKTRKLVNR